jgi:tight adherence protein B
MLESILVVYVADVLACLALATLAWVFRERIQALTAAYQTTQTGVSKEFRTLGIVAGLFVWLLLLFIGLNVLVGVAFGVVVAIAMPRILLTIKKMRHIKAFESSLIESLAMVASSLKAGLTLHDSLKVTVHNSPKVFADEISFALKQYRLGTPIEEALDQVRTRVKTPNTSISFGAMIIATQLGGNLPETLTRIVRTIRERDRVEGKLKALTAQGRTQAIILCSAPPLIGVLMYFYDPEKMRLFTSTFIGQVLLVAAIILEVIGIMVTRKIMRLEI